MGNFTKIVLFGLSVYIAYISFKLFSDGEVPKLQEKFWGPKSKQGQKEDTSIRPFKINIDEKVLGDLKARLALELSNDGSRLAPPLEGVGFEYGFNTDFLKTVGQHWLVKYDWRQREKLLNKYPSFKTQISGIDIHFQHVVSKNNKKYKKTRPLLLIHGWPGSFVEFQKMIPMLIDPKDSDINFELVIPSLPGFGFSEAAHRPGLGDTDVAQTFVKLMQRLGHNKFYVQGGDWGAFIGSNMAALFPQNAVSVHLNMCISMDIRSTLLRFAISYFPQLLMESDEVEKYFPLSEFIQDMVQESGYSHFQATKPDTLGIGLSNSPVGLAAYILEKFSTWTNFKWISKKDGGLIPHFNLDELLDNVMVYWLTNSITTSFRLYAEHFTNRERSLGMESVPVKVPTGCLNMADELFSMPQVLLRFKYPQIVQFTKADKGGHFAAFEAPEVVARDIIKLFNHVETAGLTLFDKNL